MSKLYDSCRITERDHNGQVPVLDEPVAVKFDIEVLLKVKRKLPTG